MRVTVAEAIVKTMETAGVRFVFGLPGSQTCPMYDALYHSKITHILTRHEQAAAYMAEAYAKMSGQPGVCDGTAGPGATNLVTGVATAWTDNTPVVALTGQQPLAQLGRGAFQELDQIAVFRPIVKWSGRLEAPERAVEVTRRAFQIALTGKPGPVHLVLPVEIQKQTIDLDLGSFQSSLPSRGIRGEEEATRRAAALLVHAERPIIIAGGGAHYSGRGASWEIVELAEYLGVPVATTFNGRGVISEEHPLSVGRMGVHAPGYIDEMLAEADVILAVGCRFAALSTRNWTMIGGGTKIVHVDIDLGEIGKNYPVEVGIVGDAKTVLKDLIREAGSLCKPKDFEALPWVLRLIRVKEEWQNSQTRYTTSTATPLKPQRVCSEIRRFFSRDTIFTVDAGNNKMWASLFIDIHQPRTWIQSGCFGPMGYALPAAIACKLADPKKQVVAICGDGGFTMTMYELATAVQQGTPVTVCILNDSALGTIRHQQKLEYNGRFISTDLRNPDFAKLAEAFGCYGERVEKHQEIRKILKEASLTVKDGVPAVLDFAIDREELLPP